MYINECLSLSRFFYIFLCVRVNDDARVYACACACVFGKYVLLFFVVVVFTLEGHIVN